MRWINIFVDSEGKQNPEDLKAKLQVAEVKKPLYAVNRNCGMGILVQFGANVGGTFLRKVIHRKKVMLRPNGRVSYT